jgi:dihydropteroate synthase
VEIWAILNVTPDSFSDGGLYLKPEAALARAKQMLAEGADVIDVGGASSRPKGKTYGAGAEDVPVDVEIARVAPVVEGIARELGAKVSIDTTRGEVAKAALRAGARIVNDVSMGRDPALLAAVAAHDAELVLMHTRGNGEVTAENAAYDDVVREVCEELHGAWERTSSAGVRRHWFDPGLGFAKTADQSALLLAHTPAVLGLGGCVLVGASRKSFLGALTQRDGVQPAANARLAASLVAATIAARGGAHAVRVHDVAETRQALDLLAAIEGRSVFPDA